MDQTVNLTSLTSVVRIYLFPPQKGDTSIGYRLFVLWKDENYARRKVTTIRDEQTARRSCEGMARRFAEGPRLRGFGNIYLFPPPNGTLIGCRFGLWEEVVENHDGW